MTVFAHTQATNKLVNEAANDPARVSGQDRKIPPALGTNQRRDPFNQNFRKFRSKTQWIGTVQPEKFRKNGSTFEVDHFSRSDRLEFWLNGSRPRLQDLEDFPPLASLEKNNIFYLVWFWGSKCNENCKRKFCSVRILFTNVSLPYMSHIVGVLYCSLPVK